MPDVLVSDVSMPEMDGIALAKALRERNPNCKVILISGNPKWKTRTHLESARSDGFVLLLKPFPLETLLRLIESE
jgi:DNA-binding NtrC family response regulator